MGPNSGAIELVALFKKKEEEEEEEEETGDLSFPLPYEDKERR